MLSQDEARRFAEEWIAAWNSHDLERILSHYTDDFEMSSPFIVSYTGEPSGTLKGKKQVGAYWRTALERIPDLQFGLIEVCVGVRSITLFYRSVFDKLAVEVLFLNEEGKAYRALAHYNG